METTGDLVARSTELPARVQHSEHDLRGRLARILREGPGGNPPTVVDDATTTISEERDVDTSAETLHRLVNRVVHHLPDEVMKPGSRSGTDEHPRAHANRFESLEDRDVFSLVRGVFGTVRLGVCDHG